jgi:hypothetical protein
MAKTLTQIRDTARDILRDAGKTDFSDAQLAAYIEDCLREISEYVPYEKKETLTTTANSKELDISAIEDLLGVDKIEFRTANEPPDYRNCSIFGSTLRMEIDFLPSADEDVYLYCHKLHSLSDEASTLSPQIETLLLKGAVAKAALSWVNTIRTQIGAAINKISDSESAIGNMAARITQAVNDLTSGRAFIGMKSTEAITAIDALVGEEGRISQAIADLTSGRALIGSKQTEAITAIDSAAMGLTQAAADLTNGREKIDDTRTDANEAIENMSAMIQAAITDLTSGRDFINKVNKGRAPEAEYARYASTELGNALRYLDQSRGYLSQATTSDRYANYAGRDIQAALGHLSQARAYLSVDTVTQEYALYAARELSNAATYLAQARAYLAVDQPATEYERYAGRELSNANGYLNQAGGYIRQLTGNLNIARAVTSYQGWANNELVLYQRDLRRLAKPRVYREYPIS